MLDGARRTLRAIVPEPIRALIALARRLVRDRDSGDVRHFVKAGRAGGFDGWHRPVRIEQEIKRSALWGGKRANIELGCALLDGAVIHPGELLSFWHLLGRPAEARGFAVGRSIRNDQPGGEIGGGLCQLSGLIYELGLRGGLDVPERHPHSKDLYEREEDRFTPLGLDATVVWPWKDLRLRNGLFVPVALTLRVEEMRVIGELRTTEPLEPLELEIERLDQEDHRDVVVSRGGQVMSRDRYPPHRSS
jgi:vancomycin resistance protein VanW